MKNPMELLANPTERTESPRFSGSHNPRSRPLLGPRCVSGSEPCGSKPASQSSGEREPGIPSQQWSRRRWLPAHGTPAYSWWGSFLHGFVVPNSGWIGILVAVGVRNRRRALPRSVHPSAALGSLALLFTYVMSGTASVCAILALFAIVILATWKTSGLFGVDGLIAGYRQRTAALALTPVLAPHPGSRRCRLSITSR